ncbi:MAG: hypothetical protein ABI767_16510 [Rhodanobacter sp.]
MQIIGHDAARPQDPHAAVREIHHRRFDADLTRTAVEHQVERVSQFRPDVLRRSGADASMAIGRRCRDTATKLL